MATTIKNEQKVFSVTTTTGNITVVCEVRLNEDNSLAGITQGQINDSSRGNLGSFTIENYIPIPTYPNQVLRTSLNINDISDLKVCSDSVIIMLTEIASVYPVV